MNDTIRTLRGFFAEMKRQNISAHAASSAFFLFLSFLPMLIMVCTLMPFTPITEETVSAALTEITPAAVDPLAESLVREVYRKSGGILSLAAITTLWSAGKAVLALMRGLNDINDTQENRNYFVIRLIASFYTLIILIVVMLSLIVMVFGRRLGTLVMYRLPLLKEIGELLVHFRFVFVWVILTVLFAVIYAYIPVVKLRFRDQLMGAMFAAIVWSIVSWGFSVYVEPGYEEGVYRSLSVITIVMLWMYFCMYIVLVGACINRYQELG